MHITTLLAIHYTFTAKKCERMNSRRQQRWIQKLKLLLLTWGGLHKHHSSACPKDGKIDPLSQQETSSSSSSNTFEEMFTVKLEEIKKLVLQIRQLISAEAKEIHHYLVICK